MRLFLVPAAAAALALSAASQTPVITAPTPLAAATRPSEPAWVTRSNSFANPLLAISIKFSPEAGSQEGLSQYDTEIGKPTLAQDLAQRREEEAYTEKLVAAQKVEKDQRVAQDLQIMIDQEHLGFRQQDFSMKRRVPFINASEYVYRGLEPLLDDQVPQSRREAAIVRLRKYTGQAPGYQPITDQLIVRMKEQMAKPDVIYPAKSQMETQLARNAAIVDGIGALFTKYKLTGWEPSYAALKKQLTDYDAWLRANVLPKARTDFRLTPEEYALNFEAYGIDIPPAQIATMAHAAFTDIQAQMQPLAAQIAKDHGWSSTDYRDVIRELKKQQITGRSHPAVLRKPPARDRKDHRRAAASHPAGPSRDHPSRYSCRKCPAAGPAHGAAAVPAQHRPARCLRPPAHRARRSRQLPVRQGRRLHLRRRQLDAHRA